MYMSDINFPNSIFSALRSRNLVVFAGAGVSMGFPAELYDFEELTELIAKNTGKAKQNNKPADRFLGRLHHGGIDVHLIAAESLQLNSSQESPKPTDLHRSLLRLCATPESIRIVTTNFDLLFECAAKELFSQEISVFSAPALPLGKEFKGIVHLHGNLRQPNNMVLTDRDFGRAYLTEGWARRFLVDLFHTFTVLFVGYSLNDPDMNYLVRALPESGVGKRLALTDGTDDTQWELLGIEPITYRKSTDNDHSALDEGIRNLATFATRGPLDWQHDITELARKPPFLNEKEARLIDEAMLDATKTLFFTKAADSPDWIDWLDKNKYLDNLFGVDDFREQDTRLAQWLAKKFSLAYPDKLFLLIGQHDTRLHTSFWHALSFAVGSDENALLNNENLSRWVSILLETIPESVDYRTLSQLGKNCAEAKLLELLVKIFDAIATDRSTLYWYPSQLGAEKQNPYSQICIRYPSSADKRHEMERLWQESLEPNLEHVAESLLGNVVQHLISRHCMFLSWRQADRNFNPESYRRKAIEPHKEDGYPKPVDVLIDIARDCLEWLASRSQSSLEQWCERFVQAEAPLLRRLTVHALSERLDLSPDEKIDWLLNQADLHDRPVRHEIFRALRLVYPDIGLRQREEVVAAITGYCSTVEENEEIHTANYHFNFLHWLHETSPDCPVVNAALDVVQSQFPDLQPRENPDLTHWLGSAEIIEDQSPWSEEELLSRPGSEWAEELVSFQQEKFSGPGRAGLRAVVTEVCKKESRWGFDLADVLVESGEWETDLWITFFSSWSKCAPSKQEFRKIVCYLRQPELQREHVHSMVDFICVLAKNDNVRKVEKSLRHIQGVAKSLWDLANQKEPYFHESNSEDWLISAINHPAGMLTEFWLWNLSLWQKRQTSMPNTLGEENETELSRVVQDKTLAGRLGRSILARDFAFLFESDEEWTKNNLVPHFTDCKNEDDYKAVWDGLFYGTLSLPAAHLLEAAFLDAAIRLDSIFSKGGIRERFISNYVSMVGYISEDPIGKWVPLFFTHADEDARVQFTAGICDCLRNLDEMQQEEWWERWLKSYWVNRLHGIPDPFSSQEVEKMFFWLPQLKTVFPESVDLAIQMPSGPLQDGFFLYEIAESNLWQQHPCATSKLLIHLRGYDLSHFSWDNARDITNKLLEVELPDDLNTGLRELVAERGWE